MSHGAIQKIKVASFFGTRCSYAFKVSKCWQCICC